jgi:ATP-dependent DNA helicase RecG
MEKSQIITALGSADFSNFKVVVALTNEEIIFATKSELPADSDFRNLLGLASVESGNAWIHSVRLSSLNAFVLRHVLGKGTKIAPGVAKVLSEYADKIPLPSGTLSEDRKYVEITAPALKTYREVFTRLSAYPGKDSYRLRVDKLMELEMMLETWRSRLPKISLSRDVKELNNAPIIGFTGSIDSLREIPIGSLNVVQANIQTWKALKNSKDTLDNKLTKHGIGTLYDLLFRLPRRYIDKSKPQLIDDLIIGEKATIIGTIVSMNELNAKVPGLRITVSDTTGTRIAVTFWRQNWLKSKFKVGSEVILNGTVSMWNGALQLGGDSIEHFDEGITLPVVPIYKQSESAGITSGFLIAAMRELLQRMGELSLPVYFKNKEREDMKEILGQLHFPSNLDAHDKAVLAMAYYELVYMQLIIQHERDTITGKPGIIISNGKRALQEEAIAALPYSLTGDQQKAVTHLNGQMKDARPSSNLLLADVGAGKTLTAQLACLQAVDAGFQTVFVGPTDVLARQIHNSTLKLAAVLEKRTGEKLNVVLLSGGMKAAERKAVLKLIEDGEADIIVGTHAVFAEAVKYANLGLIVIDEQQKFGAEQRTRLLESRPDGRVPDLLMQTATPIPRTTAQVYYGDVDIITMHEKPPGRTPIVTHWIQEDPQLMLTESNHAVWLDVTSQAEKGNQTFVIAPMVVDSTKIDAASVERAYKELSERTLKHLRVGFVHGSMKAVDQRETMEKFRNRELDVLVASTVIEVGVDIPDATRVVILSADRLGASSLHQIRGRVGRSSKASTCYLVSVGKTDDAQKRIQALVDSENGFEIAKIDLEIRGEGKMFSRDQSGRSDMIFAKLAQHSDLIEDAKEEAKRILRTPFKGLALRDANAKFVSPERLF